tara:strand:- start:607 stop:1158 length:552 start_codon:yes stop_codon:yes gene_type:complete
MVIMKTTFSLSILALILVSSLQAQTSSLSSNQDASYFTNIQYSESDYVGYLGGGIDLYTAPKMLGSLQTRLMVGGFAEFGGEDESGYEEGDGYSWDLKSRVAILGIRAGLTLRDFVVYASLGNAFYSAEAEYGNESLDESESEIDFGVGARVHLGPQKKLFLGTELSNEREITFSVGFNIFNR